MSDRGWICPRCEAVNAPGVLKCACSPKASGTIEERLLEELRKIAAMPRPFYIPYQPYVPYYPPHRDIYPYYWGTLMVNGGNQQNVQQQLYNGNQAVWSNQLSSSNIVTEPSE